MKLRALSHYNGDLKTRYGDCILLYDATRLVVYDCGHARHAEEVESFLRNHVGITKIHIVVSHNDSDHTDGVIDLMEYLHARKYDVTLCTSLYLKSADKVLELLDDDRRTLPATKERILATFDNIKEIVETAQRFGFAIQNAAVGTEFASCTIVGPTEDEFVEVVAKAIEDDEVTQIEGESVMNAASVQLSCKLDNAQVVLLCGDASPRYLHRLDSYDIIQLPHHGQEDDANIVIDKLKDPHTKTFLISDNTGSAANSGGADKTMKSFEKEHYTIKNTKNGAVDIPSVNATGIANSRPSGVVLGGMDY